MCEISATEVELELGTMDQVELQQVQWLWEPYIPFGKITIIQGDPGEGKTTLALRLAAACSTGEPLPGMKPLEPFNVIYQSAEDGLGDTIKPRLIDAGADQSRIWYVKEDRKALTLIDNRIEEAMSLQDKVDAGVNTLQVGHHRTHHTARETATKQQRRHVLVSRIHEIT